MDPRHNEHLRHPRLREPIDEQNSFWALNGVNFHLDVKRGQAVGIICRTGMGKSTLLNILSRITKPIITGHIEFHTRFEDAFADVV